MVNFENSEFESHALKKKSKKNIHGKKKMAKGEQLEDLHLIQHENGKAHQ